MPKPVYIIVSETGTEDRRDNLLSLFKIIERVEIEKLADPPRPIGPEKVPAVAFGFRITSVWMLEPTDSTEGTCDSEIIFLVPPSNREAKLIELKVEYKKGSSFVRQIINFRGAPPCDGSGILIVRNRMRFPNSSEWVHQDYPIVVDVLEPQQPAPAQADEPAGT